jgi:uncharacterized membrane protein YfcA
MHWFHYLILFLAAVAGGAINAVAGGGTLLTFPSLIWAYHGLAAAEVIANATNTVALWPGALSSFWGYRSELGSSRKELLALSVPSFAGGVLGAVLLIETDPKTFALLVPYLILLATSLFIVQEPLARWERRRAGIVAAEPTRHRALGESATATRWATVLGCQFLIGVYGGYFGAGIGILMLAAFGLLGFSNIHQANAIKNLNAMFINGIAAALFIAKGLIDWRLALWMAVGAIFGGYAGAGLARRLGQKNVRRLVILIGLSLALSLWLGK